MRLVRVLDVDRGGGDVGVAQVGLHVTEREDLDGEGAEGVAQVMEAQVFDLGGLQRVAKARAQWIVEVIAGLRTAGALVPVALVGV